MKSRIGVTLLSLLLVISAVAIGCAPAAPSGTGSSDAPAADESQADEPTQAEGKTYKFVYQCGAPISTPYGDHAKAYAAEVAAASNGRIEITVKDAGEVVPTHEVTDAISKGVVDISQPNSSFDIGRLGPVVYLFGTSGFPAGPDPMEYLAWVYEGGGLDRINEVYGGQYNVIIPAQVVVYPAEILCHSNKKIQSLDDLKGLKFRTMGPWAEVMESFGTSIVTVPGGEIYECAQRGVVDAFEYCGPAVNWTMGFHEIAKYIGVPGIHSPNCSNLLMFNNDEWNSLPGDLQEILRIVGQERSLRDYLDVSTRDAIALDKYIEYGTEFFTLPDDVQIAIVERSGEFTQMHCEEDAVYKAIYEQQLEFVKKWRTRQEILQPKYSLFHES
ncbi:MAG: TRAP transporter substrate-binding protein DctP [Dehalococcoidia bacterium]|nr:TRAP transporter substrate-binding protein DctP [Dehalococcoidia bacterium]